MLVIFWARFGFARTHSGKVACETVGHRDEEVAGTAGRVAHFHLENGALSVGGVIAALRTLTPALSQREREKFVLVGYQTVRWC